MVFKRKAAGSTRKRDSASAGFACRVAVGCLGLLSWAGASAFSQDRARVEFPHEGGEVVISADRISGEGQGQWVAEGDVVVEYARVVMKATRVIYDAATGEAVAEGEVSFSRGVQWLEGTRARFNLKTDQGVLYDAHGFTERELFVEARELLKTGENAYVVCEGKLTSCRNLAPTWSFKLHRAKIKQGGWARLSIHLPPGLLGRLLHGHSVGRKFPLLLTRNSGNRSFNVLVSREETFFPVRNVITRSTPTVNFKLTGQRLLDGGLYMDLRASADTLSRSDASLGASGLTERVDLFPEFYFSVPLFQGLRLSPRAGLRETFYSNSLEPFEDGSPRGGSLHRRYAELSLALDGWGLSRVYGSKPGEPQWKHLIEPFFRYHYVTGIDDFERIIRFDAFDTIVNTHEVQYGLFNRILVKRKEQPGGVHEWLSVKIAQKYFFDSTFDGAFTRGAINQFASLNDLSGFPFGGVERSFSPVTTVARLTPDPGTSFDVRTDYDPKFDRFRNFSVSGLLNRDRFRLGATYFLTEALEPGTFESNQLQAQIALGAVEKGLSFSNVFSYDAAAGRFLNYQNQINYASDCCGVSVQFGGFNIGVRSETGIRFSFFLKGLGHFGTIPHPHRRF